MWTNHSDQALAEIFVSVRNEILRRERNAAEADLCGTTPETRCAPGCCQEQS